MTRATSQTSRGTLDLLDGVVFGRISGPEVCRDTTLLSEFADHFSAHYGCWDASAERPGAPIKMTTGRLKALLSPTESRVAFARDAQGLLVAYCAAVSVQVPGRGRVDWVTQLVVAESHRQDRVATQLLHSLWGFSDSYAWGLATANPYAVRALETATRRGCRVANIRRHGPDVLAALVPVVRYLPPSLVVRGAATLPIVDTEFHVDHSAIPAMRKNITRRDRPWVLGNLGPGEEWFACTFQAQNPDALNQEELDQLLSGADRVWLDAYARMALDKQHAWHNHEAAETEFVRRQLRASSGRILDVGCGDGRHSAELAAAGFEVLAFDVVPELVDAASSRGQAGVTYKVADARRPLEVERSSVDCALLLYDVVGSSASAHDDAAILANVAMTLRPGGCLVLSVMSADASLANLPDGQRPKSVDGFVRALEALAPSKTMEKTGDVFDPELLLYHAGVFYRKEQFEDATSRLAVEHVVRDRRFTVPEIRAAVEAAGLRVELVRPVRAGNWETEVSPDIGKEILVVARKPADN